MPARSVAYICVWTVEVLELAASWNTIPSWRLAPPPAGIGAVIVGKGATVGGIVPVVNELGGYDDVVEPVVTIAWIA